MGVIHQVEMVHEEICFALIVCLCPSPCPARLLFKDFKAINLPEKLHLATRLTKEIRPCAHLNAQRHYTPTGVRQPDQCTKSFKKSATMAYDFALGFHVSKNQQYGLRARYILNAWAKTLQSADTHQSQDNVNFYLPYMNMAYVFIKKISPFWSMRSLSKQCWAIRNLILIPIMGRGVYSLILLLRSC
ncbi:putative uncharacterized protein [Helicobacter felis ATCC 49179]|uniref:Alginate lyase domain-containing protein n=1 Tax=Helicobacter felis (strain ATCC 49179 / CCUG 28539 / NCTC 12436 / CS1) TaxID=936155 RepID=E7ABQ3_HELFC|nr:putative uncharacterized protein [Helicobacter felis ATCC 49179]